MKNNRELKPIIAHGKEPLRLLALSDGVFATVLTLLVLDLRIPDALNVDGGNTITFIRWFGPHFLSYLLTFIVAGNYWLAHHRNFDHVVLYDRGLLGYNLLFLLFIGLFPFSTATLGLSSFRNNNFSFYWAIYATNMILAGILLNLTWNYAVSHHLVNQEITRQQSWHITVHQIVTPVVFMISIFTNYLFPKAFLGPYTLWLILPVIWVVDRQFGDISPKPPPQTQGWAGLLWRFGTLILWLLLFGLAIWILSL
jgi:uncharacterized membrane protein